MIEPDFTISSTDVFVKNDVKRHCTTEFLCYFLKITLIIAFFIYFLKKRNVD